MKERTVVLRPQTMVHRRNLLKLGAAGMLVPPAVHTTTASAVGPVAANDQVQVGVIGLGSRGYNLIDSFLSKDNAIITAVCDVDHLHYRDRDWGKGLAYGLNPAAEKIAASQGNQGGLLKTSDFRRLCGSENVDAVVVATPDHWHALCTLEAIGNGKDVYCEKPVTHTFTEGQRVYRAVKDAKRVFQTGSQQRSDAKFRRAVELVLNGHLGQIQSVEVGLPPGYDSPQGDPEPAKPPVFLDYDFWCGPAPFLPYTRARHHRWWRGHRAYGGGVLMDWIGHHNDIAHWALGVDRGGPNKVEAVDWTFPETPIYNTPHHYEIRSEYDDGSVISISTRNRAGVTFKGERGNVFVNRGKLETSDESWKSRSFLPGLKRVKESNDHVKDFLDCVKSRKECIAPAEVAHRSITPGHLGYVSWQLKRPLLWDAVNERVKDDIEADELLKLNPYRVPWS